MNTHVSRALAVRTFTRRALLAALAIGVTSLLLLAATPAQAQIEPPVIVPIHETVVPGQPINLFFGEVPDEIHVKNLLFEGVANTLPGAVGLLDIQFDWFDPKTGGFLFSPHFPIQVLGGNGTQFSIPWQIPFCPPEVSLHLSSVGDVAAIPITVDGQFTYQCVPEPSTFVMLGLGIASLFAYRRRKRFA